MEEEGGGEMMEDAAVSASMGVIGPLLAEITILCARLPEGRPKEEMEFLAEKLRSIREMVSSLHAVKMSHLVEEDALLKKRWAKQAREIAYDTQDFVDLFRQGAGLSLSDDTAGAMPKTAGRFKKLRRFSRRPKKPKLDREMVNKIEELKVRMGEVIERHKRFKIGMESSSPPKEDMPSGSGRQIQSEASSSRCPAVSIDAHLSALYAGGDGLVGIDGPRDDLTALLMDAQQQPGTKVVSILGPEGIGKTTLAKEVFNSIQGEFQCCAFVSMSPKTGIQEILQAFLSQVSAQDACQEERLTHKLIQLLKGKRYLVVLDGVWSTRAWRLIRCALPANNLGSRILMTTCIDDISMSCCSTTADSIYRMKYLPEVEGRRLFMERTFGLEKRQFPCCFKEVLSEILTKCGGWPIVILTIASLLASKSSSEEQWKMVQGSIGLALEHPRKRKDLALEPSQAHSCDSLQRVKNLLYVCYNDLPQHLKTCLLYLSIYPEGYVINRDHLVRRWIAEGFISVRSEHENLEEVGQRYFNELVNRGMIQPVGIQYDGRADACQVHNLILSLIVSISAEENFVTLFDGQAHELGTTDKVRRLSLNYHGLQHFPVPSTITASPVRSLTLFGSAQGAPIVSNSRALRVLDLDVKGDPGKKYLGTIGSLFQLKYLGLQMSGVVELPEQIGELQFLETLDLTKTSIRKLPRSILRLWRLVYLLVCNVQLPDGVGDMRSLEELSGIQVNNTNSANSLLGVGQLTKLRIVQLIWSISDVCGDIRGYEDNLLSSLKELSKLQSLSIESKDGSSLSFLDSWSPHPQLLQKIYLTGGYYFARIPERILSLVSLDFLDIRVYQVEDEMMSVLGSLPALLVLSLSSQVAAPKQRIVVQPGLFHCLMKFTLICLNSWTGLVIEPEALPKLARLGLLCFVQGQRDPVCGDYGIKHLSSRKNSHVEITFGRTGIWEVAIRSTKCPPTQVQISDKHHMVEEAEIIEAVESLYTHKSIEEESSIYKDAKMAPKPPTYNVEMDSQSSQEGPEGKISCLASEVAVSLKATELIHNPVRRSGPSRPSEMETAIGTAGWLVGKLLDKLSNDLVATYVASIELGLNSEHIKTKLKYMQGLLHASQDRDVCSNPGLWSLLEDISKNAAEAEDSLDELHYFMIQDQLDGTQEVVPDLGDDLRGHVVHGRHAARSALGNWLSSFSCTRTQDDDCAAAIAITSNPHNATKSNSGNDGGHVGKLKFDRVAMSNKIKSMIDRVHNLSDPLSDLLNKIPDNNTTITFQRPPTGSIGVQDKLYGRRVIFEQTVNALTSGTYDCETLSVLPFVGPGGIGKTTFTQHLYNDESTVGHFNVRVWLCVSIDFDVLNLTRQILRCIPAIEKEEHKCTVETANLDQLQKSIAERLNSKRFLIVLDDIWNCNSECDWNNLLAPFKSGGTKGNMVLVTTRFPSIAHMVKTTDPVELHGLEPNDFLEFFEECIFGHSKPEHYEDDLTDIARDIAKKLKGSPLAANTVGRLLRKNLSREYWIGVLEKNEWQNTQNDDDIMPSLKISYDYLPFLLKKCFSYCALFPQDYKFYNLKITTFWTAIGILDSSCQKNKNYLEELVDNGFLVKGVDRFDDQYYVMHDLLHELSRNVSSQECVNISSLSFSANTIPRSIRHLSITVEGIYDESFEEEMGKLKGRIEIGNLRTLMIFGLYNARIANIFKDAFEEIKCLRVLFIEMKTPQSLPNNFSNLIHLQYLKISSPHSLGEITLPSTLSRFYHLKFLDLNGWRGSNKMPKDFSRLVNLRHFHSTKELHSDIPKVGKMKCLQELKEFCVKKEGVGFELRELGELAELGGELRVCNLETVVSKGEASDAKLENKRNLKRLELVWGTKHQTIDDDVLEGLQPHPNLRVLVIINPGVAPCPRWLCGDISTKRLESLCLEGLSWATLPAFEQLPHLTTLSLKNITRMRVFGPGFNGVTETSFMHLKTLAFEDMPELVEWVGEPNCHLFSRLESIKLADCPILRSFPFLENPDHFTSLCELVISNCPGLSQFPPMPHTSAITYLALRNDSSELSYIDNELTIHGYNGALAFHNMEKVELMTIQGVSHISLSDLQKLNSLRHLQIRKCESIFSAEQLDDSVSLNSVQEVELHGLCITGEVFSKVLKYFPALSKLSIRNCESLVLVPVEGGGLGDLTMLRSFLASSCLKLFSRWPMGEVGGAHTIKPFPPSLRELGIRSDSSLKSMALLSNLTSLTSLHLTDCEELTIDGFNPLITVNLKELSIFNTRGTSVGADLLSEVARARIMHAGSFELEKLWIDSISAVLDAPICSHLAATLNRLCFESDERAETFTEDEEQALQLLTSLEYLVISDCYGLQSLPRGSDHLKYLVISSVKKSDCYHPRRASLLH